MKKNRKIEYSPAAKAQARRERLASELRALREEAGLSLSEASKHCKIAKTTLHNWESGKSCPRYYADIEKLLRLYWRPIETRALHAFVVMGAAPEKVNALRGAFEQTLGVREHDLRELCLQCGCRG